MPDGVSQPLGESLADDLWMTATVLRDYLFLSQRWLNAVGEKTGVTVSLSAAEIRWLRPLLDQALAAIEGGPKEGQT